MVRSWQAWNTNFEMVVKTVAEKGIESKVKLKIHRTEFSYLQVCVSQMILVIDASPGSNLSVHIRLLFSISIIRKFGDQFYTYGHRLR